MVNLNIKCPKVGMDAPYLPGLPAGKRGVNLNFRSKVDSVKGLTGKE